jgi:sugar/nucleoside kinase (ribokinase family)
MKLLTVGTVAFDDIETPFGRAEKAIGGAATYISLAASYFAEQVRIVSVVGDDFPESVLQDLTSRNIDLAGLEVKKGEKSFFWAGRYHNDMNSRDTLETQLNVLAEYKSSEFLMLGNLTPDIQLSVIEQMVGKPKLIALDTMNFWMDIAMESLKKVLKRIDMLIINDEEARQLAGTYSLVTAAAMIHEMGPKFVVIKKGEHGALLFEGENIFYAPALPLAEVFDPTGAGDTFAGGLMGYLAMTGEVSFDNLKRAIIYGSAMASFCVEKFSTERLLNLSKVDIDARIDKFVKLVNFDSIPV